MSEILSEDKFDEMLCYCHDGDNNGRWQIEAHDAALRAALAAAERRAEEAEARLYELERQRSGFDCRFAGPYAEMSGSHCPADRPCARCEADRIEKERDEARASVGRCHTLLDELWAITDPEEHADIMARVDAELVPCDRQYAEIETLRARLRELEHIGTGAARSAMPNSDEGARVTPLRWLRAAGWAYLAAAVVIMAVIVAGIVYLKRGG